ncbi:hypothetical protein [Kosmotoga pacifica]|uniref:Uncharacterized protein n=1 Tax=Kosmotoga pacifica TaxID=1330330 RepID=A0A0G2Z839_9BACT|nr:hypothetical protein [Kosmotoga pacifica]AKI97732.1 hypothetical protein IX53_07795 [Kosmotoga pacifica]
MFKRKLKITAVAVLVITLSVVFFIWFLEFNKIPEDVISEYHEYVKDFMESRYAFRFSSLINAYELNRSGYEKMSKFLLDDVKKLLYKPMDVTTDFISYYANELDRVNYELIDLYNGYGRRVCGRTYVIGEEILKVKDSRVLGIDVSEVRQSIQDGYLPILVKSSGEGVEIVNELKTPRVYFLKRTLRGWKIDWAKSMRDLLEK